MRLAEKIGTTTVKEGDIALFYLAQAGFCIKTSKNKIIVIDPYLSDAAERLFNFKRMIPSVISAEELNADLYLSTHFHIDHLDVDTIPVAAKRKGTLFIGAPDCEPFYKEIHLSGDDYFILRESQCWKNDDVKIRGVYADHGELAPEAIGYLLEIDGVKIYHAGDTSFRPEEIGASLQSTVDIMIVPINGQYLNMNASEACSLGALLKPAVLIACHFWMFLEHVSPEGKGDPATFLEEALNLPITTRAMVMAPGEMLMYAKQ